MCVWISATNINVFRLRVELGFLVLEARLGHHIDLQFKIKKIKIKEHACAGVHVCTLVFLLLLLLFKYLLQSPN